MSLDMTANQLKRMTLLTPPAGSLQFANHECTPEDRADGTLPAASGVDGATGPLAARPKRAAVMTAVGNARSYVSANYSRWQASTDKNTLSSMTP